MEKKGLGIGISNISSQNDIDTAQIDKGDLLKTKDTFLTVIEKILGLKNTESRLDDYGDLSDLIYYKFEKLFFEILKNFSTSFTDDELSLFCYINLQKINIPDFYYLDYDYEVENKLGGIESYISTFKNSLEVLLIIKSYIPELDILDFLKKTEEIEKYQKLLYWETKSLKLLFENLQGPYSIEWLMKLYDNGIGGIEHKVLEIFFSYQIEGFDSIEGIKEFYDEGLLYYDSFDFDLLVHLLKKDIKGLKNKSGLINIQKAAYAHPLFLEGGDLDKDLFDFFYEKEKEYLSTVDGVVEFRKTRLFDTPTVPAYEPNLKITEAEYLYKNGLRFSNLDSLNKLIEILEIVKNIYLFDPYFEKGLDSLDGMLDLARLGFFDSNDKSNSFLNLFFKDKTIEWLKEQKEKFNREDTNKKLMSLYLEYGIEKELIIEFLDIGLLSSNLNYGLISNILGLMRREDFEEGLPKIMKFLVNESETLLDYISDMFPKFESIDLFVKHLELLFPDNIIDDEVLKIFKNKPDGFKTIGEQINIKRILDKGIENYSDKLELINLMIKIEKEGLLLSSEEFINFFNFFSSSYWLRRLFTKSMKEKDGLIKIVDLSKSGLDPRVIGDYLRSDIIEDIDGILELEKEELVSSLPFDIINCLSFSYLFGWEEKNFEDKKEFLIKTKDLLKKFNINSESTKEIEEIKELAGSIERSRSIEWLELILEVVISKNCEDTFKFLSSKFHMYEGIGLSGEKELSLLKDLGILERINIYDNELLFFALREIIFPNYYGSIGRLEGLDILEKIGFLKNAGKYDLSLLEDSIYIALKNKGGSKVENFAEIYTNGDLDEYYNFFLAKTLDQENTGDVKEIDTSETVTNGVQTATDKILS